MEKKNINKVFLLGEIHNGITYVNRQPTFVKRNKEQYELMLKLIETHEIKTVIIESIGSAIKGEVDTELISLKKELDDKKINIIDTDSFTTQEDIDKTKKLRKDMSENKYNYEEYCKLSQDKNDCANAFILRGINEQEENIVVLVGIGHAIDLSNMLNEAKDKDNHIDVKILKLIPSDSDGKDVMEKVIEKKCGKKTDITSIKDYSTKEINKKKYSKIPILNKKKYSSDDFYSEKAIISGDNRVKRKKQCCGCTIQ